MSLELRIQNYASYLYDVFKVDQTVQTIQDLTTRLYQIQIQMRVYYNGPVPQRSWNINRERVSYSLIPTTFPEQLAFFRRNGFEILPEASKERCRTNLPYFSLSRYLLEILSLAKSNFPLCPILKTALTNLKGESSESIEQVLGRIETGCRGQGMFIPISPTSEEKFTIRTVELITMIFLQDPDELSEEDREEFRKLQRRVLEETIESLRREQQGLVTSEMTKVLSQELFDILKARGPSPHAMVIQELKVIIGYLPQGDNDRKEWHFIVKQNRL